MIKHQGSRCFTTPDHSRQKEASLLIIECPHCECKVDAESKGEQGYNNQEEGLPFKAILLKCPLCYRPLLGGQEYIQTGPETFEWLEAFRLWPDSEQYVAWEIPPIARNSLVEAKICFKAKAYNACAVMSGRTLEGVCKHFSTRSKTLASGAP
jgi:hypothetical protein